MTPLRGKHRLTFEQIFASPTRSNIKFADVKALLENLGAKVSSRGKTSGSRVCFTLCGKKAIVHKPHPGNELGKATVHDIRAFLTAIGVKP
jgi:hypothetical protein